MFVCIYYYNFNDFFLFAQTDYVHIHPDMNENNKKAAIFF